MTATVHPFRGFTDTPVVDKTGIAPPHNLEAEQSVLGGILLSDRAMRGLVVEEGLRPEHFYRDSHRLIFAAMAAMSELGQPIDVLTVTAHLKAAGDLARAGGRAAIDELTGGVPGLGGIRRYAQIVIEAWRWRTRLISTYNQQAAIASSDESAFDVALQGAQQLVALSSQESFLGPDKLADHFMAWLQEKPDEGLPLPPEFTRHARFVRYRAGHVTVVSGWSQMGKSLYAIQCAAHIGKQGHRSIIWTNEDTETEIVARYVNQKTGVPAVRIADRAINNEQLTTVYDAVIGLPFEVQPAHGWTATQVARHIVQERPALAVLDHFHALPGVARTEDIDAAMQTLTAAAGRSGCHLMVVCQLNQSRSVGVVRPAPVGRDLRGSGQIFNLAHTVVFVHRQEEEDQDSAGRSLGRAVQLPEGQLDVAKNKPAGRLGAVTVNFEANRLRFVETYL
jgi:replicative DNA helicase